MHGGEGGGPATELAKKNGHAMNQWLVYHGIGEAAQKARRACRASATARTTVSPRFFWRVHIASMLMMNARKAALTSCVSCGAKRSVTATIMILVDTSSLRTMARPVVMAFWSPVMSTVLSSDFTWMVPSLREVIGTGDTSEMCGGTPPNAIDGCD